MAEEATISSLLVWVIFRTLPVEYFKESQLQEPGNQIGHTIIVDSTMLATTTGKFAQVCVKVDLKKPLKARLKMRGKYWKLQYEGLHEICFLCGKYGHKEI